MNRRAFALSSAAALLAATTTFYKPTHLLAAEPESGHDAAQPFSFDMLTERMRARAKKPYEEPKPDLPEVIAKLSYDQHRAIRFRPDHALWKEKSSFELQAFHLGWLFKNPVKLYEIADNTARPIVFTSADFEYRPPLDASKFQNIVMPGVAGFRLHYPLNREDVMDELVSFLGASYFRGLGRDTLYGLSARGLAVNTATSIGEEFPRFSAFYIERPSEHSREIKLYAELESQSVTGAYAFRIIPGQDTLMDVTARLFIRKDIERLGIAPMTSMFLFAQNNHSAFDDYRGEVHDSDGLKIVRQNGDEQWRTLNNPRQLANSFFGEENPRSFGLFQRDRNYAHYEDAEANYQRRPSLLVEPQSDWGSGAVYLVELPSRLEVNDNIVAFWIPAAEIKAGQALEYRYRLTWGVIDEPTSTLARVVALRTGQGGVSGTDKDKDDGLRKFVVDFGGEVLRNISADSNVKAKVTVSNADIAHMAVSRVAADGQWRLAIDLKPKSDKPIELGAYLTQNDKRLSETWLYQWRVGDEKPF